MPFDPFEAAIQALPQSRLADLERDIDAQIVELQDQRRKVAQELAGRRPSPGAASSSSRTRVRAPKPSAKRAPRRVGKKRRQIIKKVVEAEPDKQWLPVDLEAQLHAAGDTSATRDSVRNIVREMIGAGDLARHPTGHGAVAANSKLVSTNGSTHESLKEAET